MNNESLDDLIHDYLSGVMDIETRKEFESQLASHPDMAERVRFERELYNAIGQSPENDLRANLQQITRRFDQTEFVSVPVSTEKTSRKRLWRGVGILALLGALVLWWITQYRMKPDATPAPASEPVQIISTPTIEQTPAVQEAPPPQAVQKSRPVAASYEPIPALETYVGSQYRSQDWKVTVEEPLPNAQLPAKNGHLSLRISGNIQSTVVAEPGLRVLIFNNDLKSFEAMQPIANAALKVAPDGNFLFEKVMVFKPGLYYYLIEDEESGNWLFVGKFRM
ncbi:MAG: hypothetical protein LCH81_14980 [Bacteroidetes bacterium]|nr:hypothetical protein [Bacteroidota bacterium]